MAFLPDKPADNDEIRLGAKQIRDNFNGVVNDGIAIPKPPLFGAGIPAAALGKVGERYFNTATGDQYLRTKSGWTLVMSMSIKADSTTFSILAAKVATINSVPVGTLIQFAASNPPSGYLVGDGSLAPKADYPGLYAVVGDTHTPEGEKPPVGYFYLPNYMDYFLRGHNQASGRKFGSEQGDAIRNIVGGISGALYSTANATGVFNVAGGTLPYGGGYSEILYKKNLYFDISRTDIPVASENRPINKTVLICIKY